MKKVVLFHSQILFKILFHGQTMLKFVERRRHTCGQKLNRFSSFVSRVRSEGDVHTSYTDHYVRVHPSTEIFDNPGFHWEIESFSR